MISRKGGAGKTNLAVHLAACAEGRGLASGIVDLDPQGTATKWGLRRAQASTRAGAEVVSALPASLPKLLQTARESGAQFMILDTAPHADSLAVDAARAADFILIPCRPAIADIEAMESSADIARLAKRPFAVVLNAVGSQGSREEEARQELARLGLELAPIALGHRVAYADAMIPGDGVTEHRPGSPAAVEVQNLFDWMRQRLDPPSGLPIEHATRKEVAQ